MSATYKEAIDQIYSVIRTNWNSGTTAIMGYVPPIYWPGVESPAIPDGSKYWAHVSNQTVIEGQTCVSAIDGVLNKRRYTTHGILFIQLFCPKSDTQSMQKGRALATLSRNGYRGMSTAGGVWFRNAKISELDAENVFNRLNVSVEYEYDEIY